MFKDKDKDKKLGDSEYRDPESIYPNSIAPRMWLDICSDFNTRRLILILVRDLYEWPFLSEYVASIIISV